MGIGIHPGLPVFGEAGVPLRAGGSLAREWRREMTPGNEEPRGPGVWPGITLAGPTLVVAGAVLRVITQMGPATLDLVAWFLTAAGTPAACYGGFGWYDASSSLRKGPAPA